MILQQTDITMNIVNLVQNLGFPIAVALICMFFIWQSLKYVRTKLDEKDIVINDVITHLKDTQKNIVSTQNQIVQTQTRLADTQEDINQSLHNYLITRNNK